MSFNTMPDTTTEHRFMTLVSRNGQFLNLDGTGFVRERSAAYRGTLHQARTMRGRLGLPLRIVPFEPEKKK